LLLLDFTLVFVFSLCVQVSDHEDSGGL